MVLLPSYSTNHGKASRQRTVCDIKDLLAIPERLEVYVALPAALLTTQDGKATSCYRLVCYTPFPKSTKQRYYNLRVRKQSGQNVLYICKIEITRNRALSSCTHYEVPGTMGRYELAILFKNTRSSH